MCSKNKGADQIHSDCKADLHRQNTGFLMKQLKLIRGMA